MAKPEPICFREPLRGVKVARFGDRQSVRRQELSDAYERGRQAGERALGEQLVRQRAELLELQNGALAALRRALPQVARDCEQHLVALAIEAARKLVAGLPVSTEMVEAAVREACAAVEDTAEFSVQLHPEDLALLQRVNSPLLLPHGGRDALRLEGSSLVTRGGCVVKTRFGLIDGRRETKAGMLRQALAPGAAPVELATPEVRSDVSARTDGGAEGTPGARPQPPPVAQPLIRPSDIPADAGPEPLLAPGQSREERILAP